MVNLRPYSFSSHSNAPPRSICMINNCSDAREILLKFDEISMLNEKLIHFNRAICPPSKTCWRVHVHNQSRCDRNRIRKRTERKGLPRVFLLQFFYFTFILDQSFSPPIDYWLKMSRDHSGPRGPRRTVPHLPPSRGPSSPPRVTVATSSSHVGPRPPHAILPARAAGAYSFLHGRKSNPTPVDSIFLIAIEHRIQIRH